MTGRHVRLSSASSRRQAAIALLCGAALAAAAGGAIAQGRTKAKADAWLGRDASELLLQLRVDGGSVHIAEIDATNETSYTWTTANPAWVEEVNDVQTAPAGPGLMRQTVTTTDIHHAATHRCTLTFYADIDGIIRRWEAEGRRCGSDTIAPKR